jgi:mannose-6-phosphate isomerase-like protein (cupin superfamily)
MPEGPNLLPTQRFVVSHADESKFGPHHFRPDLEMRDLGVAAATDGMASIHISRHRPAGDAAVKEEDYGWHYHNVQFQYFYVLKGWQRMNIEGQGETLMREGSGWLQPSGSKHEVLANSEDLEVLCINMPQKFETVTIRPTKK